MSYHPRDKSLKSSRRRAINFSSGELVRIEPLLQGQTLPLLIEAKLKGSDLRAWATLNRERVLNYLFKHGAILFRRFDIPSVDEFAQVVRAFGEDLLEYDERSSPRSEVGHRVYTSTDYPPEQSIFLHNEHSYCLCFPLKIFFFCVAPAARGGETPLADTRKVFSRINPQIKERFVRRGWMYVRNFNDRVGLPWQEVFQTMDKAVVEDYCSRNGIECVWRAENRLQTRQVRPAVALHPYTNEQVWFNHATFFHISTLEPAVREALLTEYGPDELPGDTYYGDGSPIEPFVTDALRQAYSEEMVAFTWQEGDILMLDNMLVAHGRAPFVGPRKILVAMSDPYTIA